MALLDGDFRTWLLQHPTISDVVVDRVHALRLPQPPVLPAIVYSLVSTNPVRSMDGYSDMRFRRVQIDIYGTDLDVVQALGETVFGELEGFEGQIGFCHVAHVRLLSERDLDEEALDVEAPLFRRSMDFEIAEHAE